MDRNPPTSPNLYPCTYCAPNTAESTHRKSIAITRTKNLLYFQQLPNVEFEKPTSKVANKGQSKNGKGRSRVDGQEKVTKIAGTSKKGSVTAATKKATVAAKDAATKETAPKQTEKTAAATTTLSGIMATKVTAPKLMTPKATTPSPSSTPQLFSISATAGLGADTAPTPVLTLSSSATAGLSADTASSTAASTPTATPIALSITAPCLLFLAINGCPQFRISGSTPEETEKNKELNAMGLWHGKNELVTFEVKNGEIRGVRVKGELYGRVGEVERR
jgi:hypothetical protein